MNFLTFNRSGTHRLGVLSSAGTVIDLAMAYAACRERLPKEFSLKPDFPPDMLSFIREASWALDAAHRIVALTKGSTGEAFIVHVGDIGWLAPIPRPPKNIFCVGRNYTDHIAEGDRARGTRTKPPLHPEFFSKPPTAIVGHGAAIPHDPAVTRCLDYEVELGAVIGREGRNIPREQAYEHVFGFTIVNDITARDLQRQHGQWFKGKGLDGSCAVGPWIVHKSALPRPDDLEIALRVNGEHRQLSRTSAMIFDVPAIIESLSRGLTLEPGDIIATGTPHGVGYAMDPPRFLQDGDEMEAAIEGIGILRNRVQTIDRGS